MQDDIQGEIDDYKALRASNGYKRLQTWYKEEEYRLIKKMKDARKEDSVFKQIGELKGLEKVFRYVESKANSTVEV